jgi:hypothetical protein
MPYIALSACVFIGKTLVPKESMMEISATACRGKDIASNLGSSEY